jgi:hypothetical protein
MAFGFSSPTTVFFFLLLEAPKLLDPVHDLVFRVTRIRFSRDAIHPTEDQ